jgi:hypothetical protein
MFDLRPVAYAGAALVLLSAGAGCVRHAATSSTDPAHAEHAEIHDVDGFLKRVDRDGIVQSYHIDDERLIVTVDAADWKRIGTARQDALKRALWEAWAASYLRDSGPTTGRIFLSVEDGAANDLGSYFAH